MHCNSNTLGVHTLQLTSEALSYQDFHTFMHKIYFVLSESRFQFSDLFPPPLHMQYIIM